MPPTLALLIFSIPILLGFRSDKKRGVVASKALFWPSLWYIVVATRPIGVWFSLWNLPIPDFGGGSDPTDGSAIDRFFYGGLMMIGLSILTKRRFKWGEAFSQNKAVTLLLVYMAASILWSHYPLVSFKRYIKVLGSIVMAMVVLTEDDPLAATFTVLRRTLYVHLPMSICCTRYFREIGVIYTYDGSSQAWQGISTSKNTLGQISMLGVIYFSWELRQYWSQFRWKNIHALYLLMAVYLLKGAGDSVSMTSISVSAIALLIFLRIQSLRDRLEAVRAFVWKVFLAMAALITLIVVHSVVMFSKDSFVGFLITKFGRDITLTDRTNIWHDVYAAAAGNPLFGVGFGGFWIGRIANIPWAMRNSWVLAQGHSGYVDSYLQLGWVGIILLARVLFSTPGRLLDLLAQDFNFGCFRITMFLVIMYVNITESTYLRGDHHLWFIFMLVLWIVPNNRPTRKVVSESEEQSPESTPDERRVEVAKYY